MKKSQQADVEVCVEVTTRIASLSSSVPRLALPVRRSTLQVLAATAVTRSSALSGSATRSNTPLNGAVQVLPNWCHFANCGAPTDCIPFICSNANCKTELFMLVV